MAIMCSTEAEPDMTQPNEAVDRPKIWHVLTPDASGLNCQHAQMLIGVVLCVPCPAIFDGNVECNFPVNTFISLPTLLVHQGWLLCLVEPRLAWSVFWSSCSIGWPGTLWASIRYSLNRCTKKSIFSKSFQIPFPAILTVDRRGKCREHN